MNYCVDEFTIISTISIAENHGCIGWGAYTQIHHVAPKVVVKLVHQKKPMIPDHIFAHEIPFFKLLNEREDRCPNIIDCFLTFPNYIFLRYCPNRSIGQRLHDYQEREIKANGFPGRVISVKKYEDPALIARWLQQVGSALEYIEKLGYCHNDLNQYNCLLDKDLNVKLADFGNTTTIGQYLENVFPPRARLIVDGPLKDTYGLCSAKTEQFALGSLLYFMVYVKEPFEETNDQELDPLKYDREFANLRFPELNRHAVFDELIDACWYNVYPNMKMAVYDFKRKTGCFAGQIPEYETIDRAEELKYCEKMIKAGLLGPAIARSYKPS